MEVGKITQLTSELTAKELAYKGLQARYTSLEDKCAKLSDIASQMLLETSKYVNLMDNLREWMAQEVRK